MPLSNLIGEALVVAGVGLILCGVLLRNHLRELRELEALLRRDPELSQPNPCPNCGSADGMPVYIGGHPGSRWPESADEGSGDWTGCTLCQPGPVRWEPPDDAPFRADDVGF